MTPGEEQAVRADERLKVLREIRNAAYKLDRNPDNDPYLWGYGAREVIKLVSSKLVLHRRAMGIDVWKEIS